VRSSPEPDSRRTLGRGDWVRLAYRLGHQAASGVLTLSARGAPHVGDPRPVMPTRPTGSGSGPDVLVLRRGAVVCGDGELAKRGVVARLARAAAEPALIATFDGGVAAYPPGAAHQVALAGWARSHLEAQLDGALAELVLRELAGIRLSVRAELAPAPLDEADRRMLAAMAVPRRLDQIWPLARTPRFRLLAFLHFLRAVGALALEGVVAERAAVRSGDPRQVAARQLLGVDDAADADTVKRAYRRLARALHPDLQPEADAQRRRTLERRFAEVTAAYEALV
jgi:DnaJ-domain-containing protein 1